MGNLNEQIKEKYNQINLFSSSNNIKPLLYENLRNVLSKENCDIIKPLLNKNLDLFYLLITNDINNEKQIIKIIKKYLIFHKVIDKNILKNEIQNEDNHKNFINLIKYIELKDPNLKINEEKTNKIIEILNSVLNTIKIEIKNEFLFMCKLNLIRIDATENEEKLEKLIEDNNNIKEAEEDKIKDYKEKGSEIVEEEISDINDCNQYSIWNDSEEINNLFDAKNIKEIEVQVKIIKVFDDDKLCISYGNFLYIYQFKSNFNLITKRKFDKYIEYILILKNKNFLISFDYSEDYLYIVHKNRLSIIDKIFLFSKTLNYIRHDSILYELSNNTIIYNCFDGMSIYNKIKGKYIFTKYIPSDSPRTRIIQMSNDYFLIAYKGLQKYSVKDYSMIKFLPSEYSYDSLLKLNNNTILLYHTGYCNILYLDINSFEIIYKNIFNNDIEEIIPVTKNIYLISSGDSTKYELNLCEILQKNNEYHIIIKNKIINEYNVPFKSINPSNKGFIFFISDNSLNVLTTSHTRIKYKKDISNFFLNDLKIEIYHSFLILICGNKNVGKTAFIRKVHLDGLNDDNFFKEKILVKLHGKVLCLFLEELDLIQFLKCYSNLKLYLVIIVYSINSKESFDDINKYLLEIRQTINKPITIFLIGNKKDLEKDRKITKEEARKFAETNRIDYFDEISLKNDDPKEIKRILLEGAKVVYKKNIIQWKKNENEESSYPVPCGGGDSLPPKYRKKGS